MNNANLPDPTLKYRASDAAVGDLDGDGEYELVIRREVDDRDPGPDGTWQGPSVGSTLFEAYDIATGAFYGVLMLGLMCLKGIIMLHLSYMIWMVTERQKLL
ncbi:hypothetical protein SFC43_20205 [Bacteroides sp. CR5/BHMF/2]|nr:hypothetical protein [Bacteroides sp. CR5/BHMF/2]